MVCRFRLIVWSTSTSQLRKPNASPRWTLAPVVLLAPSAEQSSNGDFAEARPPARCQWYRASLSNQCPLFPISDVVAGGPYTAGTGSGECLPSPSHPLESFALDGVYMYWPVTPPGIPFRTSTYTFVSPSTFRLGHIFHDDLDFFCNLQACSRPWHCSHLMPDG